VELFDAGYVEHDKAEIIIMGDIHTSCKNWAQDILQADIDYVAANPHARVILLGDILQFDLISSVGNVYDGQTKTPQEQKYMARDFLKPIKHQIIGAMSGNHENRTKESMNAIYDLCELLEIHFFDDEACFRISVGKGRNGKPIVYTFYGLHGTKGGSPGNVLNGVIALSGIAEADIYIMAHAHKPVLHHDVWFRTDLQNGNMIPTVRYYVGCGSYQGRTSYPVRFGMRPSVMGSPVVKLNGSKKDVEVSLPRGIAV
jgi:hypothetical protein